MSRGRTTALQPGNRLRLHVGGVRGKENTQRLMVRPVILALLWEAEVADCLSSGVGDQPGQHGEAPSLIKNTKN